ncbi:hypothetical protein NDU88_005506, partial [Pleurodeles waltl]
LKTGGCKGKKENKVTRRTPEKTGDSGLVKANCQSSSALLVASVLPALLL